MHLSRKGTGSGARRLVLLTRNARNEAQSALATILHDTPRVAGIVDRLKEPNSDEILALYNGPSEYDTALEMYYISLSSGRYVPIIRIFSLSSLLIFFGACAHPFDFFSCIFIIMYFRNILLSSLAAMLGFSLVLASMFNFVVYIAMSFPLTRSL